MISNKQKEFFIENGYLILEGFFEKKLVEEVNRQVDRAWANRKAANNNLCVDVITGELKDQRLALRDLDDEVRNEVHKLNDLYLTSEEILNIVLERKLMKILSELLEGDPILCNSLNFERGSQQPYHVDSWYMTPPVEDRLVAASIALEDADADAGQLTYYPKSNQIPNYVFSNGKVTAIDKEMDQCFEYMKNEVEKRNLKPEYLSSKAGDVFIWHSRLYHGGSPINNFELTRKSLVTHYWRKSDVKSRKVVQIGEGQYYIQRRHQSNSTYAKACKLAKKLLLKHF